MKVFVTGASGFIGSRVVFELLEAGHEVMGLARSDSSAAKLESMGSKVKVVRGELEDLDILKKAAMESDGVIHLGFVHDFANFEKCCQIDRKAVDAMCQALEGTNKAFVNTSGTLSLPKGRLSTEDDSYDKNFPNPRSMTEEAVIAYKEKGVRAMSIRLSPTVHGEEDKGFIPSIINMSKANKVAYYIGDGENVWPAVHRFDAAKLYVLVFEKGVAGKFYNGVGEQGVKTKDIAATIGEALGIPVSPLAPEKAQEKLAFLGLFFSLDNPTSSEKTRNQLGWEPKNSTLLEDIKHVYCREEQPSKY